MEDRTLLSTWLVTNADDSGPGSLRQAILDADGAPGTQAIDFAIPGGGLQTIVLGSPLPAITVPILIDGTSQAGYEGTPLVAIDGSDAGGGNGLTLIGSGATVRGLAIDGFSFGAAILIEGDSASQNAVYGNRLGTGASDPNAQGNLYGVEVLDGAHDNQIGSDSAGDGNTINGNAATGVLLSQASVEASRGFGGIGSDLTLNGSATIQGGRLQLTDSGNPELASAFTSEPVDVTRFQTRFTFQRTNGPIYEGLTFTIQGQGPTALGTQQPGYGSEGLGQSVTITFGLEDSLQGQETTGLVLNGAVPASVGSVNLYGTGIDWFNSDVYQVNLSYDGKELSVTITDTATGASASQVYSVDIPGTVGASAAYVGFTAGTDDPGLSPVGPQVQDVLGWSYTASAGVMGNPVVGNAINSNGGPGIAIVGDDSTGDTIEANTIAGNAGRAIDLEGEGASGLPQPPALIATATGGLMGWLHGGLPDAVYHVDLFASAGYAADGSGEAAEHLGSLDVTTDGQGQAAFDVPFTPPADLPVVTATATDPQGNTSEVSGLRTATVLAPGQGFRMSPGQPLVFASQGFALQDPDAGPLAPTWSLTLSVPAGTLSINPDVGSSGIGTLQFEGTLSAINAALAGLVYTPPPGFHGDTTLSVTAESSGAAPIQAAINLVDGIFVVTSLADSGPGSLRQAILDSNATGGSNKIAFALPGAGIQTIALASPLPQATTPTLIDGSTQPGFAGSPLVALVGGWAGASGGLVVLGSTLSVRGLAVDGYVLGTDGPPDELTIDSPPVAAAAGAIPALTDQYRIDLAAAGRLVVRVHDLGLTTRLSLLDSSGNVLVASDGQSPQNPDDLIDLHLPAGTYFLAVQATSGAGEYGLNVAFTPTSSTFEGTNAVIGDFNGEASSTWSGWTASTRGSAMGPSASPWRAWDCPLASITRLARERCTRATSTATASSTCWSMTRITRPCPARTTPTTSGISSWAMATARSRRRFT
jgi:hypothetical protein